MRVAYSVVGGNMPIEHELATDVDDPEEIKWVSEIVDRARARWQAHPEEVMTFDTPEAAMAFLDEPEPA